MQLLGAYFEEAHGAVDFRGPDGTNSAQIQNQQQTERQHQAQPGPFSEELWAEEEIGEQQQPQADEHNYQLVLDYVQTADLGRGETGRGREDEDYGQQHQQEHDNPDHFVTLDVVHEIP